MPVIAFLAGFVIVFWIRYRKMSNKKMPNLNESREFNSKINGSILMFESLIGFVKSEKLENTDVYTFAHWFKQNFNELVKNVKNVPKLHPKLKKHVLCPLFYAYETLDKFIYLKRNNCTEKITLEYLQKDLIEEIKSLEPTFDVKKVKFFLERI